MDSRRTDDWGSSTLGFESQIPQSKSLQRLTYIKCRESEGEEKEKSKKKGGGRRTWTHTHQTVKSRQLVHKGTRKNVFKKRVTVQNFFKFKRLEPRFQSKQRQAFQSILCLETMTYQRICSPTKITVSCSILFDTGFLERIRLAKTKQQQQYSQQIWSVSSKKHAHVRCSHFSKKFKIIIKRNSVQFERNKHQKRNSKRVFSENEGK